MFLEGQIVNVFMKKVNSRCFPWGAALIFMIFYVLVGDVALHHVNEVLQLMPAGHAG